MLDGWGTQRRVCGPCLSNPYADNISDAASNQPHQGPSLASLAYTPSPCVSALPSMPEDDVPVFTVTEKSAQSYTGNTTSPYSASSTSPWAAVEKAADGSVTLSAEAVSELSRVQERIYDLAGSLEELGYQENRSKIMVQSFPMEPGELTKQSGIDFDDAVARCEASISPLAEVLGHLRALKKYEAQATADAHRIAELESQLQEHNKMVEGIGSSHDIPVEKRGTAGGVSDLAKQMSKDRDKWMKKPLIKNLLPT